MGNKESRDGFFSFNEGINLCKCPIVDVVRVVFLLYHMNNIPKITKHTPASIGNAKISLGDKKMDNFHQWSQEFYQICP